MAENIRVGLPECTFEDIITTIQKCEESENLFNLWAVLGHALGTHPATLSKHRTSLLTTDKTLIDVLLHIFMDWVDRRSEEATLHCLISAFNETGLNDIASSLEENFAKMPVMFYAKGIESHNI